MDRIDRQIIHILQIQPRASFTRIADTVGVSEQTAARRYRRLRGEGVLRVVGLIASAGLGQSDWVVRVQCRPDSSLKLAHALARRDDVSWVTLGAAGSELVCSVRSRSREQRDELLLQRLPSTAPVLGISAHAVMHRFAGSGPDWQAFGDQLTQEQLDLLDAGAADARPGTVGAGSAEAGAAGGEVAGGEVAGRAEQAVALEPEDQPMLEVLARDGRAGYAALAAATGWSEGRVARRVETLHRHGAIYFDLDIATRMLGFTVTAYLWLTVEPARLGDLGLQLADHPEVPFCAAVTGTSNLLASVVCRDIEALYQYVSTRVGALHGVRQIEVSPELRRLKQAGSLLDGPRLADPPPFTRRG
ncbi:MAG TPA: Lrp/AsnC family transcriptional regulator [Streptosporangiaceae bacterium]